MGAREKKEKKKKKKKTMCQLIFLIPCSVPRKKQN